MALTVKLDQKIEGVHTVTPVGSLDTNTYSILEKEIDSLLATSPKMIIFDLEHLEYISSSGVSVVIKTRKLMKNHNGEVTLVNLQPQIEKVFEIIKALPGQRIFKDVQELDRYLDSMQKKVIQGDS
jgi:anti-anti-sigma factor